MFSAFERFYIYSFVLDNKWNDRFAASRVLFEVFAIVSVFAQSPNDHLIGAGNRKEQCYNKHEIWFLYKNMTFKWIMCIFCYLVDFESWSRMKSKSQSHRCSSGKKRNWTKSWMDSRSDMEWVELCCQPVSSFSTPSG